jgi:DNA invertase Pin-like site-specific DNA recombinase
MNNSRNIRNLADSLASIFVSNPGLMDEITNIIQQQNNNDMETDTVIDADDEELSTEIDEETEWDIAEILNHKIIGNSHNIMRNMKFYVKWKYCDSSQNSWIDESDLSPSAYFMINDYLFQNTDIKLWFVYCRISSKTQEDGNSLQSQKEQILNYIKNKFGFDNDGIHIAVINEICSAYKSTPIILDNLYKNCKKGNKIFCYSVDRLCRRLDDISKLEKLSDKEIDIYSVRENLHYNNDINKSSFISEILKGNQESKTISKRINTSIQFRRNRGDDYFGGCPPFGKKIHIDPITGVRKLIDEPKELEIISIIINMRKENYTYKNIANYLNNENIKTKRNKIWTLVNVRNVYIKHK